MFDKITSAKNIKEAYLEVLSGFYLDGKNNVYSGLDGLNIPSFDLTLNDLIWQIIEEIKSFKEIDPALNIFIPKKSNPDKNREIFIYSIKERVKAQAIYRVIISRFEEIFSSRLFSYRPGKSPYRAAQLVAKRYRKFFRNDYVFTADLSNFSGVIDREIMLKKLPSVIDDKKVLKLLSLFINNKFYYNGQFIKPEKGLVIGCPIFGLLTNFYLSDVDKKYSSLLKFYLRVGDDLIMLDPDKKKIDSFRDSFFEDVKELKLELNKEKISCGSACDHFSFLGYDFLNGMISLPHNYVKKIKSDFRSILVYKNYSQNKKIFILKKRADRLSSSFNYYFLNLTRNKPQLNDSEQIKELSEYFFEILTEFIFTKYSPRNRRLLTIKLRDNNIDIKSLYQFFLDFHYERNKKY
ncbi:hypothetical protein CVU82_03210 [Candidatus Falkowbacteria bacterium HGW-Falkowbacteria-1]|jgi:hypothetical protein|uniref:Reverse transcriptase domain-containing protein n=1 Tax=Candidatus Falkowbacteria bacterium HGW-Falkowbacteria-1 TaxID=2013768 RepID=A0A2N2E8H0_9BACT|nr:MAG: hypothetical protein CVU82_03210 [Candidatus Falkowbacteria bacterium HGW-Falkowbacteria-1]